MNQKRTAMIRICIVLILTVLLFAFVKSEHISYSVAQSNLPFGEITPEHSLREDIFIKERMDLQAVQIQFATYARVNTSSLDILLYKNEELAYQHHFDSTAELQDNQYLTLEDIDLMLESGDKLSLYITSEDAVAGNAVTVWTNPESTLSDSLVCNTLSGETGVYEGDLVVNLVTRKPLGSILLIQYPVLSRLFTTLTGQGLLLLTLLLLLVVRFLPVKKGLGILLPKDRLCVQEWGYILICGIIYLFWASSFLNINYGPDEYMRYNVPKFICENNALPFGNEESLRDPKWGFSYGFVLTLPTLLSAVFMKIMKLFSTESHMLLLAARMVSVFSMMGAAYFVIRVTKKIYNTSMRWVFIVLATLTPQIVFVSSYVNNDAFTYMTAWMILYAWIVGVESRWDLKSCVLLAIANGMCLIGYRFYWSFVLCSLFVYCITYFKYRKNGFSTKRFFQYGAIIVGVALLVCGWIYLRALVIYDGDIFGREESRLAAELYAAEGYRPAEKQAKALINNGITVWQMLTDYKWLRISFQSLFCYLGWMKIPAKEWVYAFYNGLCVLAVAGIPVRLLRFKRERQEQKLRSASQVGEYGFARWNVLPFIFLAGCITFGLSIYYSYTGDFQPQGRYIFAALPALLLLITHGLESIVNFLGDFFFFDPAKLKNIITVIVCVIVFITMLYGFMVCIENYSAINM